MITLAAFSKPEEAHLLRMRLEAGGVAAYVLDENMVQLYWLYSNAIGGVRVQVASEDLDKAREIIRQEPVEPEPVSTPTCPYCDSEHTKPTEWTRRLSFLTILLLSFPLPVAKSRYRCEDCGEQWSERERPKTVPR